MDVTKCYQSADTLMTFKRRMIVRDEHIVRFMDCATTYRRVPFFLCDLTQSTFTSYPPLSVHPVPRTPFGPSVWKTRTNKKKKLLKNSHFKTDVHEKITNAPLFFISDLLLIFIVYSPFRRTALLFFSLSLY